MRLEVECRHRYPSGFSIEANFQTDQLVTSLFGPSGSGKSTLLDFIAGLRRPTEARICFGDRVFIDTRLGIDMPPQRRQVGLVFQDHLLFPHLTVRGNLQFGRRREPDAKRIEWDRVIEVLELKPLLDRRPKGLSGGESQRVALGRALLSEPELLLLDEPLSGLDESLGDRVMAYIARVMEEWRIPSLIVSHQRSVVMRLCDQVVTIERGRVTGQGKPSQLLIDSPRIDCPRVPGASIRSRRC